MRQFRWWFAGGLAAAWLAGGVGVHGQDPAMSGPPEPVLTIFDAVDLALSNNVDLAIQQIDQQRAWEGRRQVRSPLLPRADAMLSYQQVNDEQALSSMGMLPEELTVAGVSVSQVLFSDQAFTAYRASGHRARAAEWETEEARLDVMALAGQRYLRLLSAQALLGIQADNLQLIRSNLDLARVRYQVGTSGPEEVYRWEAQEANQQSAVHGARAAVESARVALNQAMGIDQATRWSVEDLVYDEAAGCRLGQGINELIDRATAGDRVREFLVQFSRAQSPALAAVDEAMQAQRLVLAQNRRRFVAPTVNASFVYNYRLDESGQGPSFGEVLGAAGVAVPPGPFPGDDAWVVGLSASYPLFEGGGRPADVRQARLSLDRLQQTRLQAEQLIEQRIQTAFYQALSSKPTIGLSRLAAEKAGRNYDVVREKYAEGTASILDLLDAQTQKQVQEQSAAIAVYAYLQDMVAIQRALSWMEFDKTTDEQAAVTAAFEGFTPAGE